MKKILFAIATTLCLSILSAPVSAQGALWKTLSKITFTKQYDEMLGFKVDIPVFSDETKRW